MKPQTLAHTVLANGLRMLAGLAAFALVVASAWVCLIAGLVELARPGLGLGGALLAVGSGLGVLIAVILIRAPALPPTAKAADTEDSNAVAPLFVAIAQIVLAHPRMTGLLLSAAGVILALRPTRSGRTQPASPTPDP
jgi:hypothetical protein